MPSRSKRQANKEAELADQLGPDSQDQSNPEISIETATYEQLQTFTLSELTYYCKDNAINIIGNTRQKASFIAAICAHRSRVAETKYRQAEQQLLQTQASPSNRHARTSEHEEFNDDSRIQGSFHSTSRSGSRASNGSKTNGLAMPDIEPTQSQSEETSQTRRSKHSSVKELTEAEASVMQRMLEEFKRKTKKKEFRSTVRPETSESEFESNSESSDEEKAYFQNDISSKKDSYRNSNNRQTIVYLNRDTSNDIPVFKGDGSISYRYFITQLELTAVEQGWTQSNLLRCAANKLAGYALDWHEAFGRKLKSWEDYKAGLKRRFGQRMTSAEWEAKIDLIKQKKGQTLHEHMLERYKVLMKCPRDLSMAESKLYLLSGIYKAYSVQQESLRSARIDHLEELLDLALEADQAISHMRRTFSNSSNKNEKSGDKAKQNRNSRSGTGKPVLKTSQYPISDGRNHAQRNDDLKELNNQGSNNGDGRNNKNNRRRWNKKGQYQNRREGFGNHNSSEPSNPNQQQPYNTAFHQGFQAGQQNQQTNQRNGNSNQKSSDSRSVNLTQLNANDLQKLVMDTVQKAVKEVQKEKTTTTLVVANDKDYVFMPVGILMKPGAIYTDALFDTGSLISFITKSTLPHTHPIEPWDGPEIAGIMDFAVSAPLGKTTIDIACGNTYTKLKDVAVCERNCVPLLLGNDWRIACGADSINVHCDGTVSMTKNGKQIVLKRNAKFEHTTNFVNAQGPLYIHNVRLTNQITPALGLHMDLINPEQISDETMDDILHVYHVSSRDKPICNLPGINKTSQRIAADTISNVSLADKNTGFCTSLIPLGLTALEPDEEIKLPDGYTSGQPDVDALIDKHRNLFAFCKDDPIGYCKEVEHKIDLLSDKPVFSAPYRLSWKDRKFWKDLCNELLRRDLIEETDSPYAAPVIVVRQHLHETTPERGVIDYRSLNRITIKNRYPLPRIADIADKMGGHKFYCKFDGFKAYWNIPIRPEDRPKTAFVTPDGHY